MVTVHQICPQDWKKCLFPEKRANFPTNCCVQKDKISLQKLTFPRKEFPGFPILHVLFHHVVTFIFINLQVVIIWLIDFDSVAVNNVNDF